MPYLLALFLLLPGYGFSAIITGTVSGPRNEPLPFATIYIQGTTAGTTANSEGRYTLEVKPGKHTIVYRLIGYKQHTEEITVTEGERKEINISLAQEDIRLREFTVSANAEDPAYAVIRQAIKKRKFYLEQVESYSCHVYIKGVQKITRHPNKILGVKVDPTGFIDSSTGIVYLSESISKFYFRQPDQIHEEMISSKVSGNNRAFSYNQASDMLINFYENLIRIDFLNPRGFISPISSSALMYYKYRLAGTFMEKDKLINKIEVIPQRRNDPVFRGYIYIVENDWRIHSTDLFLTREGQMNFLDSLYINQLYVPVTDSVWMIFSNKYHFTFKLFGFEGNGTYLGIQSDYLLDPGIAKKTFRKNEVMKIGAEANKKDSAYWESVRPVPLTEEERTDYKKKDSMQVVRESKTYLDSVDRKNNTFKWSSALFGYHYDNRYKKTSFDFVPLFTNIQYNTVEGPVIFIEGVYTKRYESGRRLAVAPTLRYGFSGEQFHPKIFLRYHYDRKRFSSFWVRGGRDMAQFNGNNSVSPFVNSVYTLMAERNYMKLYRKTFATAGHTFEITNGLQLTTTAEYSLRDPLVNTTDYTWNDYSSRSFTSNDPRMPAFYGLSFPRHTSLVIAADVRVRFGQKYMTLPERKVNLGSKFPTLYISYRKGLENVAGSDTRFDLLKLRVRDEVRLGLAGNSSYEISAGKFLSTRRMYFMDYHHFNGNQTVFSDFILDRFHLLEYYRHSTREQFAEIHFEHRFNRFLLNKIPLIRKLKLNEIAGVHCLSAPSLPQYIEVFAGIEKMGFRVDFVTAFSDNQKLNAGLRFGLRR